MRTRTFAFLLSVGVVAACSSDRAVAPKQPAPQPHLWKTIVLPQTGTTPPFYQSFARAINDSAVVVGYAQTTSATLMHAVAWRPPQYLFSNLPDLGGSSFAYSIGNDGTVGGEVCDPGDDRQLACHPAYWRNGVLHQLAGVGVVTDVCPCDGHTLVGRVLVGEHDHAAIWEDDILIDIGAPAGSESAELIALSNGYFVGQAYDGSLNDLSVPTTNTHSYRWSPTTGWVLIGAPYLGSNDPLVIGVNSHGTAVGAADVIWPNGSSAFTPLPAGFPGAINDSSVVAGECIPSIGGSPGQYVPCEWSAADGWTQIGIETFSTVLGVNNSNMAVGNLYDMGRSDALLWIPPASP